MFWGNAFALPLLWASETVTVTEGTLCVSVTRNYGRLRTTSSWIWQWATSSWPSLSHPSSSSTASTRNGCSVKWVPNFPSSPSRRLLGYLNPTLKKNKWCYIALKVVLWLVIIGEPLLVLYSTKSRCFSGSSAVLQRFFGMTEGLYSTATIYRTC